MSIDVFEKELKQLINPQAKPVRLETGFKFTEGPVWNRKNHSLYFSDIPGDTIYCYSEEDGLSVFRKPSNCSNGLVFDSQGRLVGCEHQSRRVTRTSATGIEVIVDEYNGKRLNSPNDLVISRGGVIFFTDPLYGLSSPEEQELDFQGVFCVPENDHQPVLLVDDFETPNGLAFSPDERYLYINDSNPMHIRKFVVDEDNSLSGGDILCEVNGEGQGKPDGMKVDARGNIYCTGPLGIWIFTPTGNPLGRIRVPERVSNLNWGGEDNQTLYITASTSIYKISCLVAGNSLF